MNVNSLPLSSLKADPKNARDHDERNLAAIRESLMAHGQVTPLLVQSGTNIIIAGNGTATAMAGLKMTDADVVLYECSDLERERLAVRLNRTAELAGWDQQVWGDYLAGWRQEEGDAWDPDAYGFNNDEADAFIMAFEGFDPGDGVVLPDPSPHDDPADEVEVVVVELRVPPEVVPELVPAIQGVIAPFESLGVVMSVV